MYPPISYYIDGSFMPPDQDGNRNIIGFDVFNP
jgi:hypothetical protein